MKEILCIYYIIHGNVGPNVNNVNNFTQGILYEETK